MIIGRKPEQKELLEAANSEYSKFVAVYGRRRVGKTFLIRETFNYSFTFQHAGLARGKMKDQLLSFRESLKKASGKKYNQFKNWYEAFFALEEWLSSLPEGKKIVFFDELPWMDTPLPISYPDWNISGIAGLRQEKTFFSLLAVQQPLGLSTS